MMGWRAIGAVFTLPQVMRGAALSDPLAIMINWWLWGALTPLAMAFESHLAAACKRPLPLLAAHAGFGLALSALYVAVAATLGYVLGLNPWKPWENPQGLFDWYMWAVLVYGLIMGTLKVFHYYQRHLADELKLKRLERQVLETRLNALRMQLDPQLLFDALDGISAYVELQPKLARKMIEHLGDLLRMSLATRHRQDVTLAEEVAFLEHYFALHRMRFAERLTVTLAIEPEVARARIPALLLQPLVDNAIRHGIAVRARGGSIIVSARRVDGKLDIRVIDDGVGLPPGWQMASAQGQGLSVTRERLLAMYPAHDSDFALARRTGGGTEAKITLPLDESRKDRHEYAIA